MPPYAARDLGTPDPAPYPPVDGTQPCAAEDPELFFLEKSSRDNAFKLPRALECCAACPFRRPCLAYALTHAVSGVWGGTTANQRDQLRADHGLTAEPVVLPDQTIQQIDIDRFDRGGASAADVAARAGVTTAAVWWRRRTRSRLAATTPAPGDPPR